MWGAERNGDLPGLAQLLRSWAGGQSPRIRCPVLCISTQPRILPSKHKSKMSLGKLHLSHCLLVTWISQIIIPPAPGPAPPCSSTQRYYQGEHACQISAPSSSPPGQPVFMKIGWGRGGGISVWSLSSFIWSKLELVSLRGKLSLKTNKEAEDSAASQAAQGRPEIIRIPCIPAGYRALTSFHFYHLIWSSQQSCEAGRIGSFLFSF